MDGQVCRCTIQQQKKNDSLKGATVEAYASAFEHELMDEARRLLAE